MSRRSPATSLRPNSRAGGCRCRCRRLVGRHPVAAYDLSLSVQTVIEAEAFPLTVSVGPDLMLMQPVSRNAVEGLDEAYTEACLDFTSGIQTTGTTIDARWKVAPDHSHVLLLLHGRTPKPFELAVRFTLETTGERDRRFFVEVAQHAGSVCGSTPTRRMPRAPRSRCRSRTCCSSAAWASGSRATCTAAPCTGSAESPARPPDHHPGQQGSRPHQARSRAKGHGSPVRSRGERNASSLSPSAA